MQMKGNKLILYDIGLQHVYSQHRGKVSTAIYNIVLLAMRFIADQQLLIKIMPDMNISGQT